MNRNTKALLYHAVANIIVKNKQVKYMMVAMILVLANIPLNCLLNPIKKPVANKLSKLPILNSNAKSPIAPTLNNNVLKKEIINPRRTHPINAYIRFLYDKLNIFPKLSASFEPARLLKESISKWCFKFIFMKIPTNQLTDK